MKNSKLHGSGAPSEWVKRWSHLVAPHGHVLDVACGSGRHAYHFYQRNCHVTIVDRDLIAIESVAIPKNACDKHVADIETGPWPLPGKQFDAVVVTNYLWRPLMPRLLDSVAPGGVLIYETFAHGNETVGKPSRPDFLLRPRELLESFKELRVVAFEDGFVTDTTGQTSRFVQRIVATREAHVSQLPTRYLLSSSPPLDWVE